MPEPHSISKPPRRRASGGPSRRHSCSKRVDGDAALWHLEAPPRGAPGGRRARRRPSPPSAVAGAGAPRPTGSCGGSGGMRPVSVISPSGSPVLDSAPELRHRLIALGQRHERPLRFRRPADQHDQQPGGERVERAGVARLDPPSARRTAATTSWEVIPAGLSISRTPSTGRASGAAALRRRVAAGCPSGASCAARRPRRAGTRSAARARASSRSRRRGVCPPPPWARAITDTSTSSSVARSDTLCWPAALAAQELADEHRDLRALQRPQVVDDALGVALLGPGLGEVLGAQRRPSRAPRRRSAGSARARCPSSASLPIGMSSYSRR